MAKLYDEICRILATPMPRSRALKLIFGGIAGAVLAPFSFGQACPTARQCAGVNASNCCPTGQQCCNTGSSPFCCPNSQTCCSNTCCNPSEECQSGVCVKKPTPHNP